MKRTFLIFFASLAFTGCAPDWSGTFVGPVSATGVCTAEPVRDATYSQTLSLVSNGDTVQLESGIGRECSWIADIHDDKAYVRQLTCSPVITEEGHYLSQRSGIRDGMLTLDGDTLRIEFHLFSEFSGSVGQMCNYTNEGTLDRQ